MSKVLVGMSGGVDSAVAAYMLKIAGYDVIGITLKTWVGADGKDSRCCEIDDAEAASSAIGIPYYVENCVAEFKEKVTEPFIREYIKGRTPNPCIGCNRDIKWEHMLKAADRFGAQYIATGHYAYIKKLENGRYTVKSAEYPEKDQTYMLYKLGQEQLARTLMPLGAFSKEEVRNIAEKAGIPVAHKADSQDICFVPDDDHSSFIEENATETIPGEGNFVDEDGKILGRHKGIINYTIGQRKGLGLPLGYPAYVKKIDAEKNEVVISTDDALYGNEVFCSDCNFLSIPMPEISEKISCLAKVRYHHKAESAVIERIGEDEIKVVFEKPVRAAAPGQSAVFYDGEGCVIGGGVIDRTD